MSDPICLYCRRASAKLSCGVCCELLCKSCAHYLDSETFSYLPKLPDVLGHTYYCDGCYRAEVEPALHDYQEILVRAREVYFFFDTQRKQFPLVRRSHEVVEIADCPDRDETILRLGFLAAQRGFNSVIEAQVTAEKIRNEGYQKSRWAGRGVPAQVDSDKVARY